jgi:hypothetical protein
MTKRIIFLMYHELGLSGRTLCDDTAGYRRYVVSRENFEHQLAMIATNRWFCCDVTQALRRLDGEHNSDEGVCVTFDDGCATDLSVAAPLLLEKKFNATFYITATHVGKRGYLARAELSELATLGFEIGSHSLNHRYLVDLQLADLRVELSESKKRLEDLTGMKVNHFSCPGGRVNALVVQVARETGYQTVATSRIGINTRMTDRFNLARIAVKESTTTNTLAKRCRGEGLLLSQTQDVALSAAKRLLGNSIYERVRSGTLR